MLAAFMSGYAAARAHAGAQRLWRLRGLGEASPWIRRSILAKRDFPGAVVSAPAVGLLPPIEQTLTQFMRSSIGMKREGVFWFMTDGVLGKRVIRVHLMDDGPADTGFRPAMRDGEHVVRERSKELN